MNYSLNTYCLPSYEPKSAIIEITNNINHGFSIFIKIIKASNVKYMCKIGQGDSGDYENVYKNLTVGKQHCCTIPTKILKLRCRRLFNNFFLLDNVLKSILMISNRFQSNFVYAHFYCFIYFIR